MAHFARINENSVVTHVLVVPDEQEHRGQDYLAIDLSLGGTWKRCSYNTRGGVHYNPNTNEPSEDQSKAYRKNYPGIGFTFDEERDAFIPPQTYPSWVLNENTCLWEPPIPYPDDGNMYSWDEDTQSWVAASIDS